MSNGVPDDDFIDASIARMKRNPENYLVYRSSGKDIRGIIGFRPSPIEFSNYFTTPRPATIVSFYLDKNSRRQGVGTLLFNNLINIVREKGYTEVFIDCGEFFKETAWGFYDRMTSGNRVGVLENYYPDGSSATVWGKVI